MLNYSGEADITNTEERKVFEAQKRTTLSCHRVINVEC